MLHARHLPEPALRALRGYSETRYRAFYLDRLDRGLPVDRRTCPYTREALADARLVKRSMFANPFEKLERKRFVCYSKDLGMVA